ncbi:hypothetical protein [Streptomyces sp. NBC_00316]|uniref:hypothetical protein n=1 Tax=Streptomyces sp. NBC_00316 TaxID=2975710 RepID=UPI002E2D4FF7|nr:hypothetical protein [Streptomyces sp. NBC_00316]
MRVTCVAGGGLPLRRSRHEPEQTVVARIRRHGTVLELSLLPREYYCVTKSGAAGP